MRHLVIAVALVAICAAPASAQEQTQSDPPVHKQVGGTVVPPREPGWTVVKSDDFETLFQKKSEHEVALVSMKTLNMDMSGDSKAILRRLESVKDADLARLLAWNRDSIHFNHVRFKSSPCVQYDGVFVAKESSARHKYLNFNGYLCAPNATRNVIVQLEASSESSARGMAERLSALAEDFFESTSFATSSK